MANNPDDNITVESMESETVKRKPGRPIGSKNKAVLYPDHESLNTALPAKRGRPKGSKNKIVTKRPDSTVAALPGDNTKYLTHDLTVYRWPDVDINNLQQVKQRIDDFFSLCATDDVKPSIACLALAFKMSRFTLFDCLNGKNGRIKNLECIHTLKTAYDLINSYYEHMMNNGKINPVAGIFLMKNNMGYKDTTDYVINTNQDKQDNIADITNRAGLLID